MHLWVFAVKIEAITFSRPPMKTTSIFTMILLLTLWVSANVLPCKCASSLIYGAARARQIAPMQDTCKDCGHAETCCTSHTEQPTVMSLAVNHVLAEECLLVVLPFSVQDSIFIGRPSGTITTRAPPSTTCLSVINTFQQLQI